MDAGRNWRLTCASVGRACTEGARPKEYRRCRILSPESVNCAAAITVER
jgi:hypothetical protein